MITWGHPELSLQCFCCGCCFFLPRLTSSFPAGRRRLIYIRGRWRFFMRPVFAEQLRGLCTAPGAWASALHCASWKLSLITQLQKVIQAGQYGGTARSSMGSITLSCSWLQKLQCLAEMALTCGCVRFICRTHWSNAVSVRSPSWKGFSEPPGRPTIPTASPVWCAIAAWMGSPSPWMPVGTSTASRISISTSQAALSGFACLSLLFLKILLFFLLSVQKALDPLRLTLKTLKKSSELCFNQACCDRQD